MHPPVIIESGRLDAQTYALVWRLASGLTRDTNDADDLVQEVSIVVWRKRDAIPSYAWPWLVNVVRKCAHK